MLAGTTASWDVANIFSSLCDGSQARGLGLQGDAAPSHNHMLRYVDVATKARDERRFETVHPSSGAPDLRERWECSTNATGAAWVHVQQPFFINGLYYTRPDVLKQAVSCIRTLYMKGLSYAMETTKAAEANRKGVYPTPEARGLYALAS